jgi:DNA repair exonuclease SbcCD nuclease subunit
MNNLESVQILENKISSLKNLNGIILAGDILDSHEKIHSQLLNRAYHFIEMCIQVAPTYVLVGNHDYINNQQFLTSCHWMNGMKKWNNVFIVDKPLLFSISEINFICVPYVPPGRLVEALNTMNIDWKNVNQIKAIFAHQEILGCKMGAITSTKGDEWNEEWPVLISGHIHDRQKIGKNVIYPGSSINHSFGSNNQGIFKYDFFNSNFSETLIELNLEKKKNLYLNVNEINSFLNKLKKQKFDNSTSICISGSIRDLKVFKQSKDFSNLLNYYKVKFVCNEEKNISKTIEKKFPFIEIVEKLILTCDDPELEKDFISVKTQCQHI